MCGLSQWKFCAQELADALFEAELLAQSADRARCLPILPPQLRDLVPRVAELPREPRVRALLLIVPRGSWVRVEG